MLTFQQGNMRFNYRVAGVAISDGRVLLHRSETDNFWAMPGGRGEFMESAEDTLRREMQEEIAVDVCVERLLWIVENFFAYEGMQYHEICMYFLMQLPDGWPPLAQDAFHGEECVVGPEARRQFHLNFQWFPLHTLEVLPLYPSFLRRGLQSLPETIQHVVHIDEE